jgi:ABC-type Fe3+-siderophore transport system permease subunit
MKKEGASENLGLFSTVLGVMSIALPLASFPLGLFFGSIVGFVLAILALVFAYKSSSWRKPAFTLAIIGILLNLSLFMWILAFLKALGEQLSQSGALEQLSGIQASSTANIGVTG